MKNITIGLLSLVLLISLTACSYGQESPSSHRDSEMGPGDPLASENSETNHMQSVSGELSKALVVYFSCTGNTEEAALSIADQTGADVYEIVPEQPYTEADLDYQNEACRANQEMRDPSARPAMTGGVDGLENYEVLYLGYPIWWGTMPKILHTFLDRYDLSGKTVLPFCTSGGSGMTTSVTELQEAEPEADIREGLRISSSSDESRSAEIVQWLEENGLSHKRREFE